MLKYDISNFGSENQYVIHTYLSNILFVVFA